MEYACWIITTVHRHGGRRAPSPTRKASMVGWMSFLTISGGAQRDDYEGMGCEGVCGGVATSAASATPVTAAAAAAATATPAATAAVVVTAAAAVTILQPQIPA